MHPPPQNLAAASSTAGLAARVSDMKQQSHSMNRDEDEPVFVPRKLFLRGFCPYGKESSQGLSAMVLVQFWMSVSALLQQDVLQLVMPGDRGVSAPRFRNRQLTIYVADGSPVDAAYVLCRDLNEILKSRNMRLRDREVYFTPDQPAWKKRRNYVLKSAEVWVLEHMPALPVKTDWPAGRLWRDEAPNVPAICLGEVVSGEWVWSEGAAAILAPLNLAAFSY
jgi:hypothetical protein